MTQARLVIIINVVLDILIFINIKEYDKSLALFPNNALTLNFKSNAFLALSEYEQAIETYNLSLSLSLSLSNQNKLQEELLSNP